MNWPFTDYLDQGFSTCVPPVEGQGTAGSAREFIFLKYKHLNFYQLLSHVSLYMTFGVNSLLLNHWSERPGSRGPTGGLSQAAGRSFFTDTLCPSIGFQWKICSCFLVELELALNWISLELNVYSQGLTNYYIIISDPYLHSVNLQCKSQCFIGCHRKFSTVRRHLFDHCSEGQI